MPGIASTYRTYALVLNRLAERFRTISVRLSWRPPGDGARLGRISHDHLVDDLFGLIDHLRLGAGLPGGHLVRIDDRAEGARPRARAVPAVGRAGSLCRRRFTAAEKLGSAAGPAGAGHAARLPLRDGDSRLQQPGRFPPGHRGPLAVLPGENGRTPIRALAHRATLADRLDLRPTLPRSPTESCSCSGR